MTRKYKYKYKYLTLKYKYKYLTFKYKYFKSVLEYRSSTSTSTKYYKSGDWNLNFEMWTPMAE